MMRSCIGSHAYKGIVDSCTTDFYSDSRKVNLYCRKGCRSLHYNFTILIRLKHSNAQNGTREFVCAYFIILLVEKRKFSAIAYRKFGYIKTIYLETNLCSLRKCFLIVRRFGNDCNWG